MRVTSPMLAQLPRPRSRALGVMLRVAVGGPALIGVLLAPSVLVMPFAAAMLNDLGRSWRLALAGVSLLLLAGAFAVGLRVFLARLAILKEAPLDALLFLFGSIVWMGAVFLLAIPAI